MIDPYTVWMVPENEEEERKYYVLEDKITDKTPVTVTYDTVKKLMKMDYIVFGKDRFEVRGISGVIKFEGHFLKDKDFQREVAIDNKYFKPFIKYLSRNMKMYKNTLISFFFGSEAPVIVQIGTEVGAIAPYIGEI